MIMIIVRLRPKGLVQTAISSNSKRKPGRKKSATSKFLRQGDLAKKSVIQVLQSALFVLTVLSRIGFW